MCSHDKARFFGTTHRKGGENHLRLRGTRQRTIPIYVNVYVCAYAPMYKRRNSVRPRTLGISQLNDIKFSRHPLKARINKFHEPPKLVVDPFTYYHHLRVSQTPLI